MKALTHKELYSIKGGELPYYNFYINFEIVVIVGAEFVTNGKLITLNGDTAGVVHRLENTPLEVRVIPV